MIDDLGSTNGSTVDGVPLDGPTPIAPGQLVRVGNALLTIRRAGAEPRRDDPDAGRGGGAPRPTFAGARCRDGDRAAGSA